jgi:outer membrane protein OmpA-like peptidoglycan-associated protein
MRRIFLITILSCFTTVLFGQFTTEEVTYGNRIDLENDNSWAVGGGFSNFIMHGDLRSMGTGSLGNFYNFGAFINANKMFNPLLGLEFKATYSQISGGAQYFSNVYEILYVPNTVIRNNMYFEGSAYGLELNLVLSFTNLYQTSANKYHAAGYFGFGYHQYNSQLFEKNLDGGPDMALINFGNNPARTSVNSASSIFLSAQLGIKRRITNRVDLELRSGMYFNYEDHLDATISNKQTWETFFITSIGVAVKIGKKRVFTIWGDQEGDSRGKFKIIDTDKDGVMDQLDTEPNTPAGVMVYGNGKAVDSDKDGTPDYKDKCPLKHGPITNKGCPTAEAINNQIASLATNIYFNTNSDIIKPTSFATMGKIIDLMKKVPKVKFVIEGHTDNKNSEEDSMLLSQKRANAVMKFICWNDIKNVRLKAKGFGESNPKFSNQNVAGRQFNKRVEIKPSRFVND